MRYLDEALENCHCRAEAHTEGTVNLTFTDADTYYQLTDIVDGVSQNFTISNGALTYTGTKQRTVLFNGSSDASLSNFAGTAVVTYTLFLNDVAVSGCSTPIGFAHSDLEDNFSCTQEIQINPGDVFTVKAKCTAAAAQISIKSFSITFWGR